MGIKVIILDFDGVVGVPFIGRDSGKSFPGALVDLFKDFYAIRDYLGKREAIQ